MSAKASIQPSARAVIFDMDGTLTQSSLDFDQIRKEVGLRDEPILEAMRRMEPEGRARTEATLLRHEQADAEACELRAGAVEVVARIRSVGILAVLMTRNSRRSVETVLGRHRISFDLTWTRDDGPTKPSPEPVLKICHRLHVKPEEAWVVGDFHFDITCGAAAGSRTVLLVDPEGEPPDWATEADHVIHRLSDLLGLLGLEKGRRD